MKIHISLADQYLHLLDDSGQLLRCYAISSAKNGPGELRDSGCTPRGRHIIRAKIGAGLPLGAVLVGRRPTGEVYSPALAAQFPQRDWILSRILWLSGCEVGFNRLGHCDSMRRYIYLHGTPDTEPMGVPRSHGCIRMRNADIVELFERVPCGTVLEIFEGSAPAAQEESA